MNIKILILGYFKEVLMILTIGNFVSDKKEAENYTVLLESSCTAFI